MKMRPNEFAEKVSSLSEKVIALKNRCDKLHKKIEEYDVWYEDNYAEELFNGDKKKRALEKEGREINVDYRVYRLEFASIRREEELSGSSRSPIGQELNLIMDCFSRIDEDRFLFDKQREISRYLSLCKQDTQMLLSMVNSFEKNTELEFYDHMVYLQNELKDHVEKAHDKILEAHENGDFNSFKDSTKVSFHQLLESCEQTLLWSRHNLRQIQVNRADVLLDQMVGFQFIFEFIRFKYIAVLAYLSGDTIDYLEPQAQEEQPSESARIL